MLRRLSHKVADKQLALCVTWRHCHYLGCIGLVKRPWAFSWHQQLWPWMTVTLHDQRSLSQYFDMSFVASGGSCTAPLYVDVPASMVVWPGICTQCSLLPKFFWPLVSNVPKQKWSNSAGNSYGDYQWLLHGTRGPCLNQRPTDFILNLTRLSHATSPHWPSWWG